MAETSSDAIPAAPLTLREVLQRGTERLAREGIDTPGLDMSLLLAAALGTNRIGLYADLDRVPRPAELDAARALLVRRLAREPVAYILGHKEFYSLTFAVSPAVLIPRRETEHLVDAALGWMKAQAALGLTAPLMADIGTGSGAIAISLAKNYLESRWIAVDLSPEALEVARANIKTHGVEDRVELRQGSLLDPIAETLDGICANLPYVAEAEREILPPEITQHEPDMAFFSKDDGLGLVYETIRTAPDKLRAGGLLVMECGEGQAATIVASLAADGRYAPARIIKDLAGVDRVIWTTNV